MGILALKAALKWLQNNLSTVLMIVGPLVLVAFVYVIGYRAGSASIEAEWNASMLKQHEATARALAEDQADADKRGAELEQYAAFWRGKADNLMRSLKDETAKPAYLCPVPVAGVRAANAFRAND